MTLSTRPRFASGEILFVIALPLLLFLSFFDVDIDVYFITFGLLYLSHLWLLKDFAEHSFIKLMTRLFWLGVAVAAAMLLMHYLTGTLDKLGTRNFWLLSYPVFASMTAAAVYVLAGHYQGSWVRILYFSIVALLVGGLISLIDHLMSEDYMGVINGLLESNVLFDRNTNHADDYFVTISAVMVICVLALSPTAKMAGWMKACIVVFFIGMAAAFIVADSLGAYFGLLAALLLVLTIRMGWWAFFVVPIVAIAFVTVLFMYAEPIKKRAFEMSRDARDIISYFDNDYLNPAQIERQRIADGSIYPRIAQMKNGAALISERPLTGYGIIDQKTFEGADDLPDPRTFKRLNHVHNFFLDLAIMHGIPFAIFFLALILTILGWLVLKAIRYRRHPQLAGPLLVLVALFTYYLVENLFDKTYVDVEDQYEMHLVIFAFIGLWAAQFKVVEAREKV